MKMKVVIHPGANGRYWAEVPAFPGCFSEGDDLEEIRTNIREAAQGWLEAGNDSPPGEQHPGDRVEEFEL
jgi:predicted RNase H-like HicB family nuclease